MFKDEHGYTTLNYLFKKSAGVVVVVVAVAVALAVEEVKPCPKTPTNSAKGPNPSVFVPFPRWSARPRQ